MRLARLRRRTSLFVALFAVAAVAAGLAAGASGWLSGTATAGVRGALAEAPGALRALVVSQPLGADPAGQDDAVRAVIAHRFGALPITVVRLVSTTGGLTAADPSGAGAEPLAAASMADLADHATLDDGAWPDDAGGATMQVDAAQRLGLAVGDTVDVGGTRLTLTGVWHVDPDDPAFHGDDLWLTGATSGAAGPVVIDESLWPRMPVQPEVQWVAVPDIARVTAEELGGIQAAWAGMPTALRDADLGSASLSGRFLRVAAPIDARLAALQTAVPLSLVIVAAIAVLALWELLGLLARTRSTETGLLWSRGATPAALSSSAAVEAATAALLGGAAGTVAAAGIVAWTGVPGGPASVFTAALWALPVTVAVAGGAAAVRTRATVGDRAVRPPRLAGAGAVVLLCAAAAVATWQLLAHGAVTGIAQDDPRVEPIAVLAPGLLLVAAVSAAVLALPFVLGWADVAAGRSRGDALAVRGVSRRVSSASATVVAVGLAVGQIVIAAGYSATWSASFAQTQQLHAGSPLRIASSGPLTDDELAAAASVAGVDGVAPVSVREVRIGTASVDLIGVTPAALRALASDGAGAVDIAGLAAAVDVGTAFPSLPASATAFTVDFDGAPPQSAGAWLVDAWGMIARLDLAPGPSGAAAASVPRTEHGPWQVVALDAQPVPLEFDPDSYLLPVSIVTVSAMSTDAGPVTMPLGWTAAQFSRDQQMGSVHSAQPSTPVIADADALVRFVPAVSRPIALSAVAARRAELEVGTTVGIDDGGSDADLDSADIVALPTAVPGSDDAFAALVDGRSALARSLVRDREPDATAVAWISTRDVPAVATRLRTALPAEVMVRTADDDPDIVMLGATATALWAATAGCLVLAIVCLAGACAAQARERRDEVAVLRSLGLPPARQGALRRAEQWMAAAWGAVAGVVAGGVVVLIPLATLARAGIPSPYSDVLTLPRWDPLSAATAGVVLVVAIAVVIMLYGADVARQAARAVPGGPR